MIILKAYNLADCCGIKNSKLDPHAAFGGTSRKMKSDKATRWLSGVSGVLNSAAQPVKSQES